MTIRLAKRVQRISPSPAARRHRQGRATGPKQDIIRLGAGEPISTRPSTMANGAVAAIRGGDTRYTSVEGATELKDAIIAKFRRDNGLEYNRAQVLVSSGAKQTVFNLCCALLDSGDEAIIPAPLLGVVPRHGPGRGRHAGPGVCGHRRGIQDHARPARLGHHAAHATLHPEQPKQPDR